MKFNQLTPFLALLTSLALVACEDETGNTGADETSEEGTDSEGTDGEGTDGEGTDGEGTDGEGTDGEGTDGEGTDGEGTDGEGTDGEGNDGEGTDGEGTDGEGTDGEGTDGEGTDGEGTDGEGGEWEAPENAEDYPFDAPASYLYQLTLNESSDDGFDLTGDGAVDNALGGILSQLGGLLGDVDVNAQLADAIDSGTISIGFSWPTVGESIVTEADLLSHLFLLANPDAEPALSTTWDVSPESFMADSGTPLVTFPGYVDNTRVYEAGPAVFQLGIPLGPVVLDASIEAARMRGTLGMDSRGVTVTNGKIGGAVPMNVIYRGLNGYVDAECACLNMTEGLIDIESGSCNSASGSCGDTCDQIAQFCGLALNLISPDVDLDNDGTDDAISASLSFQARGILLGGIEQ